MGNDVIDMDFLKERGVILFARALMRAFPSIVAFTFPKYIEWLPGRKGKEIRLYFGMPYSSRIDAAIFPFRLTSPLVFLDKVSEELAGDVNHQKHDRQRKEGKGV